MSTWLLALFLGKSSSSCPGDSVPGLEEPSESLRVKYPGESALAPPVFTVLPPLVAVADVDFSEIWSDSFSELFEGLGEVEEAAKNMMPGAIMETMPD